MSRTLAALACVALLAGCDTGDTTTVTTTLTSPTPIYPTTTSSTPCAAVGCTSTCPNPALGCTGGGGGTTRAPEILQFGADSSRISKGSAAVLRWDVSDFNALVRIDPGIGSVATVGFVIVNPTQTTTYTLTARNNLGTVQRQLTVVVFNPE